MKWSQRRVQAIELRTTLAMSASEIARRLNVSVPVAVRYVQDFPLTEEQKKANLKAAIEKRYKGVVRKKRSPEKQRAHCRNHYRRNKQSYIDRSRLWKKANYLTSTHGITNAQYLALLDKQGGLCAMCRKPPIGTQRLVVDHDHRCCPKSTKSCGRCVRGLLHRTCNLMLGSVEKLFADSNAKAYLIHLGFI